MYLTRVAASSNLYNPWTRVHQKVLHRQQLQVVQGTQLSLNDFSKVPWPGAEPGIFCFSLPEAAPQTTRLLRPLVNLNDCPVSVQRHRRDLRGSPTRASARRRNRPRSVPVSWQGWTIFEDEGILETIQKSLDQRNRLSRFQVERYSDFLL